ncbi:MAG: hypothetical protein ABSG37_11150 [Candidatus Limnocylindrales bacterium]
MGRGRNALGKFPALVIGLCVVLSGCAPQSPPPPTSTATPSVAPTGTAAVTLSPAASPTATSTPFPVLTLQAGNSYFSLDGQQSFVLSRNPTGKTQADFDAVLGWARQGGTRIIRVHIIAGWLGDPWINPDWSVDEQWAEDWDRFFDQAQADGIYVIPVFGVWADWNDGTPDWDNANWKYNPLNSANGGPVSSPGELFISGSDTQNHWLDWVRTLVERWQGRQNIAAWEIFSEINIASGPAGHIDAKGGVDEATGVDFTNKAMAVVHAADPQHRPVTLSLAGVYAPTDQWADYYHLASLDFIEIHPYSDTLDRELVSEVHSYLATYKKPVMIGESGLWSTTFNKNAPVGIEHATWAGLVSGAMNGRALWTEDGYSIYGAPTTADAMAFMQTYATTELPVAKFASDVDFSGFGPLTSSSSSGVWGAAVGNGKSVLGWFRDASSEPPNWGMKPVVSKQSVTITVPGTATSWRVDFYDTRTGTTILSSTSVTRKGNTITIPLPDFHDDIAFKLYAQ